MVPWRWRHICPLYQEPGIQTPASTSHDLCTPVTPAPRDVMPHTELWVVVAAMWPMGTDPGFSATVAGVLNRWPIALALY